MIVVVLVTVLIQLLFLNHLYYNLLSELTIGNNHRGGIIMNKHPVRETSEVPDCISKTGKCYEYCQRCKYQFGTAETRLRCYEGDLLVFSVCSLSCWEKELSWYVRFLSNDFPPPCESPEP